jgi:hypothetical protein
MYIELKYLFPIFIGIVLLSHGLWRTLTSYLRLRAYPGPFIASLTDFGFLQPSGGINHGEIPPGDCIRNMDPSSDTTPTDLYLAIQAPYR